jgi:transposase-like protein
MVSYEAVRRWVNHFGPVIAANLRRRRSKPHTSWHLDAVYLKIDGRLVYLWRAVDAETRRNKRAMLKMMCKLLKNFGFVPDKLVPDDLRSYAAAASDLGIARRHDGTTIERTIRISGAWDRRKDFSQSTQQLRMFSTCLQFRNPTMPFRG